MKNSNPRRLARQSPRPDRFFYRRQAVSSQFEDKSTRLRSRLRSSVEQVEELQTEELRANDEALQALNEELLSSTEELEKSREKLQSVNEELITVSQKMIFLNHALRVKN